MTNFTSSYGKKMSSSFFSRPDQLGRRLNPWRGEKHLQINLATDASGYKWGALVMDKSRLCFGDETDALINTIPLLFDDLKNYRVDDFVDNEALVSKNSDLNDVLMKFFELSQKCNIDLKVQYIATKDNPADKISHSLSLQECQLSEDKWNLIQSKYGPHTVDLMALDSNVMLGIDGKKLKHFTPFPSPLPNGDETNPYVFPPFGLISPVLNYFTSQKLRVCIMVVPELRTPPVWWPIFWSR
ncbi:hypothetical protein KUTeg_009265, partial [Tegillarca granosa]